ncbi:MAG: hypothetical protein R2748_08740 [Bryobacterales bacterium]
MAEYNEGTAEELEEVSGRWLRDQLRGVTEDAPTPAPAAAPPRDPDTSSAQLIEGLAASISAAVAEPIRDLESRREARQTRLEESLRELSGKLGDAFVEIARVRDRVGATEGMREQVRQDVIAAKQESDQSIAAAREESKAAIEAMGSEARTEIERIRSEHREELERVNAAAADLRSGFDSLAEEIGRLQEKVREQHERIDALRFRETQRAKAMNELARASSSLREALSAAAAMSAISEEEQPGVAAHG